MEVIEIAPGNYLVSLRGMGGLTGNNVVVLVDGTPINNRVDGTVGVPNEVWSLFRQLAPDQLERKLRGGERGAPPSPPVAPGSPQAAAACAR